MRFHSFRLSIKNITFFFKFKSHFYIKIHVIQENLFYAIYSTESLGFSMIDIQLFFLILILLQLFSQSFDRFITLTSSGEFINLCKYIFI